MLELPFTPVYPPISHQASFLASASRRPYYALFWEQGTGKTKAIIDNIILLAIIDGLTGAFVLGPNGVHRNWHVEELPKHWAADAPPMRSMAWNTQKAGNKAHQQEFRDLLAFDGIQILCMSYDGLLTEAGKQASWEFLKRHKAMYVGDESQRFKTPGTARTKTVIKSSVYAAWRRIASGTPMDKPFDIYSQMRFLDPLFWVRALGLGSFAAFKTMFANIVNMTTAGGRTFPQVVSYRNLDQMADAIAPASSRVLKEDVLDLPPKNYKRVFHELTPAQRQAYNQLKDEALTFLESGELVTAEMALILDLRLTQITSGFIMPYAGAAAIPFNPNPRFEIFKETLKDLTRPAIIWGRFIHDTEIAAEASRAAGRIPVIYDGDRPEDSLDAFHAGKADDIIANIDSSMREGYTLNEADSTLYYSNGPKLLNRQQSEDRNHRIGQNFPVTYFDFCAEKTLDAGRLKLLVDKRKDVGMVLGDDPRVAREWLMEALSE